MRCPPPHRRPRTGTVIRPLRRPIVRRTVTVMATHRNGRRP
jgi:hypothetical protein